jgi:arabinogalactan endo-1,4-beta-galactosidase
LPEANEYWRKSGAAQVTTDWYNMGLWDNENGKATPALYELKNFINDPAGIEQITNTHHLSPNTSYYDLQGRKVAQPKQGLYIVNGKKVVVK